MKKLTMSVGTVFLVLLTAGNARLAVSNWETASGAHDWGRWHWDKSHLEIYLFGSHKNEAIQAINDWNNLTDLRLTSTTRHKDMSVWGADFGDTGWGGLATIEDNGWDWHCWANCRVTHGHARFNSYYTNSSWWARGIFCQEVGHIFGLGHNSRGGCMGLTYYANQTNRPSSHDVADVNNKY